MAVALLVLMLGAGAALASTSDGSIDTAEPCPTTTETPAPDPVTTETPAPDPLTTDAPDPTDTGTSTESPDASCTDEGDATDETGDDESADDGNDPSDGSTDSSDEGGKATATTADCDVAAGIDPSAPPTTTEPATGLDNAIQQVYRNCVAHPNAGLVNALHHLTENRDAKALRDAAHETAAADRAAAKAERKAAHDAAKAAHMAESHGKSGEHATARAGATATAAAEVRPRRIVRGPALRAGPRRVAASDRCRMSW